MINKEKKQDYVNNKLYTIYNELKKISNVNFDYMVALIYIMYKYRNENFNPKAYNFFELAEIIDGYIQELNETDRRLFRNVRFIEIIDETNFEIFQNIIIELKELIGNIQDEKSILAEGFESLIINSIQNNENILNSGEFYTPEEIVKTMVDLADIKDNMTVYNPFSSSGGFLKEAAKKAKIKICGQEKNENTYNIYKTNLWLNDVEETGIISDKLNSLKPDFVIFNPPFSEDMSVKKLNYYETPYFGSSYTKHLLKAIDTVNENGKISIILPHGFLFKKADQAIRRELIEKNLIDTIIALPENLFYRTRIPVIIVLIDKKRRRENVLFIDASNEFVSRRKVNYLSPQNQDKIISTYREYKQVENYSYLAHLQEIRENDYNLSIRKYVRFQKELEVINKEKIESEICRLEEQRYKIQREITEVIKTMKE